MKVPLTMVTALALYVLLRVGRAVGFFRTATFPVMTPAVAVGILFLLLFNGDFGIVNWALALSESTARTGRQTDHGSNQDWP